MHDKILVQLFIELGSSAEEQYCISFV